MKKAFILVAHQLPEQVNILIHQLISDGETDVFVHVDKKVEATIKDKIEKGNHIFFIKNNVSINWGENGLLRATLNSYREILATGNDYKYVFMVTGQDLLVKDGLDEYLEKNNGRAFIDCDNDRPKYYDRFKRAMLLHPWPKVFLKRYDFKLNPIKILRALRLRTYMIFPWLNMKKLSFNVDAIQFYYDKVWHAFPIDIVKYIITFLDENPSFWEIYENSFMADEGFFTTVIRNSPYRDCIVFENQKCHSITFNKKAVNNHPPILTMEDVKEIELAESCYFARKFDSRIDNKVIEYFGNTIKL